MQLRLNNLRQLEQQTFDVLIVGGGINGAVSAASLAAKGARVALIDQGDFAGASSSHSSNLAW
ncbi:MAG: FAD-dependent oxidoreductase, partial [Pseudomonadota bacterium]|nr:FAD-dependent oxidoreductase [Pseudomonadota bacterium]